MNLQVSANFCRALFIIAVIGLNVCDPEVVPVMYATASSAVVGWLLFSLAEDGLIL